MADLEKAVALLEADDWQAAHVIVQDESGRLASWAHGIVHLLEGDLDNARYWYRQAHRTLHEPVQIDAEIAALKREIQASQA